MNIYLMKKKYYNRIQMIKKIIVFYFFLSFIGLYLSFIGYYFQLTWLPPQLAIPMLINICIIYIVTSIIIGLELNKIIWDE